MKTTCSRLTLMLMLLTRLVWAQWNTGTYVGCYSSSADLVFDNTYEYQSTLHCQPKCVPESGKNGHPVMAFNNAADCWCGSQIPPDGDKVDDDECDKDCTGFGENKCGGRDTFSVYLTGLDDDNVETAEDSTDGSSSSSDAAPAGSSTAASPRKAGSTTVFGTSIVTEAGKTIIQTAPIQAIATNSMSADAADTADTAGSDAGPNKVGIAVGVVVGVVALAALIGAAIFFIRRRKRRAMGDGYHRNQTIDTFVNKDKPHSKSGSISDQRLDPSMLHRRRQSDGSIADEMDFSRRILQVNPPAT